MSHKIKSLPKRLIKDKEYIYKEKYIVRVRKTFWGGKHKYEVWSKKKVGEKWVKDALLNVRKTKTGLTNVLNKMLASKSKKKA